MTACSHLYVHVPFCDGKCIYCGFYSVPFVSERADRYLGALEKELDAWECAHGCLQPETLYVGGGTPGVLTESQMERLCATVRLHCDLRALREWTLESNPGLLSRAKLSILKQAGVNRVSLGVQSLDDATLRSLGRRHSARDVVSTVALLRESGFTNLGLDLIAALPGVGPSKWEATLDALLSLAPEHVSVYALSVEEGTVLERRVQDRQVRVPGEKNQLQAMAAAERALGAAGYGRYEISNFARPGCECLHNLACWRGHDYLGAGPAASSRLGLVRRTHAPHLKAYCDAVLRGDESPGESERIAPQTDWLERLAFGFRTSWGVDLHAFTRQFPSPSKALLAAVVPILEQLQVEGLVRQTGERWVPTARGMQWADRIAADILAANG